MLAYQKERIENAICYFAREHQKRAQKPAYQTYIYKYLALFDFRVLEKTGKPALDIEYDAYERGPVPRPLYNTRSFHKNQCYKFKPEGENSIIIEPARRPNLNFFSEFEIEIMNQILAQYAHPWITTDILNEASHEIPAWQKVWSRRGDRSKVPMSYDDNFDNINNKSESELTREEDTYLVYKALKTIAR
ncbi:MAG: DUF4065 domain-containing protein [Planctomycetes bacterium]|nr:DUF4065 domain-containing protein [Planctomycetota bacterium]